MAMAIAAGMPCAITNPLEPEIKRSIMAANLMMGTDENCLAWIAASREEAAVAAGAQPQSTEQAARASAADVARAEREARRAARRATTNTQDNAAPVS